MSETSHCFYCKNFIGRVDIDHYNCRAFPKKIPNKILFNGNLHDTPYPNDNGIMFEPTEEGEFGINPDPIDDEEEE